MQQKSGKSAKTEKTEALEENIKVADAVVLTEKGPAFLRAGPYV